jgi:metal-sulfur cluster biosynthetic enzyme
MGFGKILSGLFRKEEKGEAPVDSNSRENRLTGGAEKDDSYLTRIAEVSSCNSAPSETSLAEGSKINPESDNTYGPISSDAGGARKEAPADAGIEKVTEEKILEVLSNVYDPEIPIDIVNLGLIYGIDIDGGNVRIIMTMTAPGCPASTQIAGESKILIEELPGVDSVDIELVWDPPWDPSKMSEDAQQSLGM